MIELYTKCKGDLDFNLGLGVYLQKKMHQNGAKVCINLQQLKIQHKSVA